MHKSITAGLMLIIVFMIVLSSCVRSDNSDGQDIMNNLLINEDTSMHENRLFDVETPYTLCYKNNDGTVSVYIFPSPISYVNEENDLELIDVSLITVENPDYKKKGYALQTKAGDVTSYYPRKANDEFVIANGEKSLLSFAIDCEQSDECQKSIFQDVFGREHSSATYNSSGDCSFICIPTATGTIIDILFNKALRTDEISFFLDKQSIKTISTINNTVVITPNSDLSQTCVIRSSYLKDAVGKIGFNNQICIEEQDQKIKCTIKMDKGFLLSPDITYPVSISASFDVLPNSLQNITAYSNKTNDFLSDYSVIGANDYYGEGSLYMKFRIGYLLKSYEQNVKSASLCFYCIGGNDSETEIKVDRLNGFWYYSTSKNELPEAHRFENSISVTSIGAYSIDITKYIKACIYDDTLNTEDYGLLISSTDDESIIMTNYNNSLYKPYVRIDFYDIPWTFEKIEKINP